MRIIQIIDSLEAGGAERMAVNYANTLADVIDFSGLVTTRKEGSLLNQINPKVSYLFLNKKKQLDFAALFRLRSFVLKNRVTHIHAHSTSFFFAFLLKLICPSVKLIWHYHYGNNQILSRTRVLIFRTVIPFFSGVIAVNQKLKLWIENNLKSKNVIYLPNFSMQAEELVSKSQLYGNEGKRIVSLANMREDKNHFMLLEVAYKLKKSHPDWTFHLVGKDFEDYYSEAIFKKRKELELENHVFLYGSREDVSSILDQSDIGILTSASEGLPLALLEYGEHGMSVVVTDVGEIPSIIKNGENGFIVSVDQTAAFYSALLVLVNSSELRSTLGNALNETIKKEYSAKSSVQKYLKWTKTL